MEVNIILQKMCFFTQTVKGYKEKLINININIDSKNKT
jgi:hypothetical protein